MDPLSNVELFRADLHCHTNCSDGSLDPIALIDLAVEKKLDAIAITDHDTVSAYETAVEHAQKRKILLGIGVEFSCTHLGESVHLLGYDFDLSNLEFLNYCKRQQEKRMRRNEAILKKLSLCGILIRLEELLSIHAVEGSIGRPHIAQIMKEKGCVKTIQEAFVKYLGDGKKAFVPGESFPVEEAKAVIHKSGGKVFIAHPHLHRKVSTILQIIKLGVDGIECYYGAHMQNSRWKDLAKSKNLLLSGGSDFHGSAKPHISLGCSYVDRVTFNRIFTNHLIK